MSVYENDLLNSETYKRWDCCFEKVFDHYNNVSLSKNFVKKGEERKEKKRARLLIKLFEEWISDCLSIMYNVRNN